MPCKVESLEKLDDGFFICHRQRRHRGASVVIATGGLSIPKIGATDFGYQIADQFGLTVVETAPRPGAADL